jgi:hypothetical protein
MQVSLNNNGTNRPEVKVGDRVQFNIGEEVYTDTIAYVYSDAIEGETYDLTHVNFTVVEK